MRVRLSVLLLLFVSLVLCLTAGCSRDTTPPEDPPSDHVVAPDSPEEPADSVAAPSIDSTIAFVNGEPIDRANLERGQAQLLLQYRGIYTPLGIDLDAQLQGAQGRLFELRVASEALETAITRALISQELEQRNAEVSQADVDAEFQEKLDAFLLSLEMSEQELAEAFNSGEFSGYETGGLTFDQFITNTNATIREDFEILAILPLLTEPIEPTEAQLVSYFETHRSEYEATEMARVSHILMADEESAKLALKELDLGVTFETLARDFSLDTATSAQGGDLGWIRRGQLVESLEDVVFATPEGEAAIAQTDRGYHVIRVTGYLPENKPEYEDIANLVTEDYRAEIMDQHFAQWHKDARSIADISVEDALLKAYRMLQEDEDQGLQALLDLRDAGTSDDLYLSYIIGTVYESRMDKAKSEQSILDGYMTITPSQQQQAELLQDQITANRNKALAFYGESLALFGSHAEIEARIQFLSSLR